jgi:hypothetical protein
MIMSFEHTAMVWGLRRAGSVPGGAPFLALLYVADQTDTASGEVWKPLSYRDIANVTEIAPRTVRRTLSDAIASGLLEITRPPAGTRGTRYRWAVAPSSTEPTELSTARTSDHSSDPVDNSSVASRARLARTSDHRARTSDHTSAHLRPPNSSIQYVSSTPSRANARGHEAAAGGLDLVVGVEARVNPSVVRHAEGFGHAVAMRIRTSQPARFARLVIAEGEEARTLAAEILRHDGLPTRCPVEECGAENARAILEPSGCSTRGPDCPYLVPPTEPSGPTP